MRYLQIPSVSFTDANGNTRPVKDLREIPEYPNGQYIIRNASELVDEMASRPETYGKDGEMQSYKILEANAAAILDAGFDLTQLRKLFVPA
jgi:hypothetical protein